MGKNAKKPLELKKSKVKTLKPADLKKAEGGTFTYASYMQQISGCSACCGF